MVKTIYVGNLPFRSTEEELREIFAEYGTVHSAKVITDRETGRSRGFGFVEMDTEDADVAIKALDGTPLGGRNLQVNEARDKKPKRQDRFDRRF